MTNMALFAEQQVRADLAQLLLAAVEASEYQPVRKGAQRVMTLAKEHYQYDGELSLDPESRRILTELRKPAPAFLLPFHQNEDLMLLMSDLNVLSG